MVRLSERSLFLKIFCGRPVKNLVIFNTKESYVKIKNQKQKRIKMISSNIDCDFYSKTIEDFESQVGKKIGSGDYGTVWEKKGSDPKRVYKVIQIKDFGDGSEAKIAKIAGDILVGPTVHDIFLIGDRLVVIEMDYAGKTLGHYMERVAADRKKSEKQLPAPKSGPGIVNYSRYQIVPIKKPERASIEDTIHALYDLAETFYFQLFCQIKKLAENKISYGDLHVGNIIPLPAAEVKLIDFGSAKLHATPKEAKQDLVKPYIFALLKKYQSLPGLSRESQELIDWFDADLSKTCALM